MPPNTFDFVDTQLPKNPQGTDPLRWRLKVEHGRQTWHYLENDEELRKWPQSICDKYWLGIPFPNKQLDTPKTALEAARNGFEFFKLLQTEDGHWAGEYGGPMFLLPGIIIAMYITHTPIPKSWSTEITRYLFNRAHKDDGGWGIHIEGPSTVFGTALNYVALRILGVDADHPVMVKSRATLHKLGGAIGSPSWGKFWLAVLNVYDWEGLNPIIPEFWLLPYSIPFHPGRFWCHTRMVYLPMSYIYGKRVGADLCPFIKQLRQELYVQPYESINWAYARNDVCEVDLYVPHPGLLGFLNGILSLYEKIPNVVDLRKHALNEVYKQVKAEDENTFYLDLGPVNKAMNLVVAYLEEGPDSEAFKLAQSKIIDFMWMSAEGMMMNGTNGSQLWDTAFTVQAVIESGLADEPSNHESMLRALEFLDDCQIKRNVPETDMCYRHISKGAWPFSTRDQGYTVSDSTAEGLKAVLLLQKLQYTPKPVSEERLRQAVDVLLSLQNSDGGFASYELIRGPWWLEWINPAEVFDNIMIEYSYPECTTSVLTGLCTFREYYPDYREVCNKAAKYIHKSQKEDGGWYGSWAICFTYAALFATTSRKGCEFLISRQREDGGWGESYKSCELGEYVQHAESQVVNTSWAVLALMSARYPDERAIRKGIEFIMSRQQLNGEWKQEGIEGVFNKNCMISYPNYKFTFTIWALGRYAKIYKNPVLF
ncbi:8183_t:CDS:10 [Ambispora gerdemannii]|uniref:Terpene cyclase/mutase family member n=1 Tax=Ambispora gerdemannii TaxID=144530 RepID=A0A9N9C3R2_9GLOM|nr:8183_t:CDS:10 [Ambispora gerdemannii]